MFNNKKNGLTLALQLLLCVALLATQVIPATLAFAETVPGTTEEVIVPTQEVVTPTDPAPTDNGETVVTAAPTDTAAPVDTATPTALPTDTLAPVPTATEEIVPTDPVEEGWTRTDTMPMDVRDILTNLGFAEDLMIDRFTLQFTEDGEVVTEPSENAQIEITFHVSLPEGITAQIREGDWYVIQMPDTLALSGAQIITLTADDVDYARVELETGPLRVKFSDAAQGLETIEDSFTVQAAFLPDVYTPGEEVTLSLPNEEAAPVSFTMAAAEEDLTDAVEDILQDPSDIVAALLSGQGLVTGYTVGYLQDGNYTSTPTVNSTIEASLTLTLTQAIADAVAAGDTTYTITLPQAMSIASEQALSLDLASGMFTSAVVGTDKTLTLTFADDVSALVGQPATLDFTAAFDPSVVTAAGAYSLALAGEVNAPQPQAVIYDSTTETGWTRQDPSDTMNVQDIYTALGISPASILTGINLLYQEPNSTDISETEATVQAAIDFYMSMFIPSAVTQNMRNGDTYTVQLPDDVNVIAANTYPLFGTGSNSGVEYGQVNVAADGKITFTFNENVQTLGDATGSFHFGAKFNETVVKTPGEHVIEIPNDPANISTTVNIISNEDQTIDKKGEPDKPYNTSTIDWTVDFNKPAATLTNAVLTDRIPEGLKLTNVRVYTVDVDVNAGRFHLLQLQERKSKAIINRSHLALSDNASFAGCIQGNHSQSHFTQEGEIDSRVFVMNEGSIFVKAYI